MRTFFHGLLAMIFLLPLLAGCAPLPGNSGAVAQTGGTSPTQAVADSCRVFGGKKQIMGAVAGTVFGAGVGFLSGGLKGALIGGGAGLVAGGLIGTGLDHHDCEVAEAALQSSLASTQSDGPVQVPWTGTNHSGLFNVQPSYTDATSGQVCRKYTSTITAASGSEQTGTGITCRDSNGDWHIM